MIKFDVSQIDGLGERLAKFGPEFVSAMVVDPINEAAESAYTLGRRTILLTGINLTDDYLQRRMVVEKATDKKPAASITALGGRAYTTQLSHYGAMQSTEDVRWNNSWILENVGGFAPWPGWTERVGDPGRGIAAEQKAAGVSVEVFKGKRKTIRGAITIPGKKDTEGNPLVFRRYPIARKKVDTLQGPAVYQLFRAAIPRIEDEVTDDLEQRVVEVAQRGLEDLLE